MLSNSTHLGARRKGSGLLVHLYFGGYIGNRPRSLEMSLLQSFHHRVQLSQ